jgi:hypothetical protein
MVQTSDGGFTMTGSTDAVDPHYDVFPPDYGDGWFVKTDEFGNMEWNKTYGGDEGDYVHSLTVTSDGGFALSGYTSDSHSDFWLVKIDSLGNMLWNKTYGGEGINRSYSMIESSDGGFLLAG